MSILSNTTEAGDRLSPSEGTMPTYKAGEIKRPPLHPGEILGGILRDNGNISVRAAAAAIELSHVALNDVVRGKAAITPDMALRIGAYLGNGPDIWLRMQAGFDLWHARKKLGAALDRIAPLAEGGAPKRKKR